MRVLIIEDEIRLARNIAKTLKETASYAVDISTNGEDGWHQALSNPYDLILLDLMLPKVGGWRSSQNCAAKAIGSPCSYLPRGTPPGTLSGV